jgi:hypothetical protein
MDVMANPKFNRDKFSHHAQRFHELVYNRDSLKLDPSNFKEKLQLRFTDDKFVARDNRTFFVFSYTPSMNLMGLLSWCEKEELGF